MAAQAESLWVWLRVNAVNPLDNRALGFAPHANARFAEATRLYFTLRSSQA